MTANNQEIARLQAEVEAAQQEFDMAVTFHEVWKPAAYDEDLHKRMGQSRATNAFLVVRVALRREMLLALMRLWDKDNRAVRMDSIAAALRKKHVIDALAADRAASIGLPEAEVRKELGQRADAAVALIEKYAKSGSHGAVREKLKTLRDERLAHRTKGTAATGPNATDGEIESFYQDTSELVRLLLSLFMALAYDPQDAASVYRHYATLFWAGVRGERTEGHPNYRAPPRVTAAK
jgi:hypothetical protein